MNTNDDRAENGNDEEEFPFGKDLERKMERFEKILVGIAISILREKKALKG